MVTGGKLQLKGGNPWDVKKKKAKKKKAIKVDEAEEVDVLENGDVRTKDGKIIKAASVSVQSNRTYEQEFALEMQKAQDGKVKNTPWGSSFKKAPDILHGYSAPITGKNAEERLDLRCAIKTDKFCK
ncbi:g10761 [Coccomyxa viridis]|uniref:G10761 protein n=1 Tax=Coccomyxa viridis TaxID=1274662 RepID=A0ABP1G8X6_9CHLO